MSKEEGFHGQADVQSRPTASEPLYDVRVDLLDLQASPRGLVDHHSRFIHLIPLCNKSAEKVNVRVL